MAKKFIQKMHLKKGALHKDLGIPMGEKIPKATLEKAASRPGKVGRRARTAEMLEGLPHKAAGGHLGEGRRMRTNAAHQGKHHNVTNPKTHHHKLKHE